MASRVCSVANMLFVCLFILIHAAGSEARATHLHCAPACQCYQLDGLRAANCSSLDNISSISHSVEVLRVVDHLSLKDELFSPLVNLKRLYLSHLGLHKVHPRAFSGLHQLETLDLSHNHLADPTELAKAVNRLPKLERLLLRENPLGNLPLLTSEQLVFLDLGSCKISNISDSFLKNLSGLKHLKLDNNRLTVIKPKWLPQSIVSLDLSSNYIRHFSRHEFQNLSHLEHIEISGNPIHCTCETLKIRYDFIMNNVVLCVYPVDYRGVDLFSLKKRQLCPKTASDNRSKRQVEDDQEYEDEDDYFSDDEAEQGHNGDEGSAKSDASKPLESEGIHPHSSEQDPHLAADSPSRDEDKEQEDTDVFPVSEEDKEIVGSVLDDTSAKNDPSDAAPNASEGDGNKEEDSGKEEKEEAESVVDSVSTNNEHDDTVPHASEDGENKEEDETNKSAANEKGEEKDDTDNVLDDASDKKDDVDTTSGDDENKEGEETDNSPASDKENDDAGSVLDDSSAKDELAHAAPNASEGDGDKDEEDTDTSVAKEEEIDGSEDVLDDNKNEHSDGAPYHSEGVGNTEIDVANNSPASGEETAEAEDVVDGVPNENEHGDTESHTSEGDDNKDEEDTDNSPASEEVGSVLDDTSAKNDQLDTAPHTSEGEENKDEEDSLKSTASEEEKDGAESVLDDTSVENEQVDAASLASEGDGNQDEEDTRDEKEEAVGVSGAVSAQNEREDIAPHPVVAEKEEETTNSEEAKDEHVASPLDESSAQNEHEDILSHVSLEAIEEHDGEDGDETKESDDTSSQDEHLMQEGKEDDENINGDKDQESEHQKEEETGSAVDDASVLEEHVSHAPVGENEHKENDETGEEVDDSLNELSKEDLAGNAFEASGEERDKSEGQEEATNIDNEETHVLLSPASASQNETSAGEEDQSSRMVVFDSDEDQVDHDAEVDQLHNISSNEHKVQSSEDEVDHEESTETEVDELHNISSSEHNTQDREDGTVDHEEEQGLNEHHERNETSASTEEDKDIEDLMNWNAESSDSAVIESQEEGEDSSEDEAENRSIDFGLPPTSETTTEPSVLDVESASNETHSAGEGNATATLMDLYDETDSDSSKAAYDVSEELEDVSGKHDYMFEEIEGSGTHEDLTPILLEGSGFDESATESSTEDASESSGYAPLFIGVHSVIDTSHQVENDTKTGVVDDFGRTTVSPHADNSLELEEENSGHGPFDEIPIIPPVEPQTHDTPVTTEKEPVVEEEVVAGINVYDVEGAGPPLVQTSTNQPEMVETSTQGAAEVETASEGGGNETHGDIKQQPDGEQNAAQDSAGNSAGSYIVLGVIMCIIVILLAYAVIRSHQRRKRSSKKDIENPGRELQDVTRPLMDCKPPPSKEQPVDETREPLMSKEKEAALSSEQSDNEPVKNGDLNHVPEVVVEKQPHSETDAPAQNNGTAKKPEPNGTLTAPLVNGNGVAAPVSPSSGRVKVVAKELPDSVAKRPILIVNRGTDPTV